MLSFMIIWLQFPLMSKRGKIASIFEELQIIHDKTSTTKLEEFPGGLAPGNFLVCSKTLLRHSGLCERLIKTMEARGIRPEHLEGTIMYYARSIYQVSIEHARYFERRKGMQLELATLDCLLITFYSVSDTLYDTDYVERIIHHFVSSESGLALFSPPSLDLESSLSSEPSRKA
ncbi:hypothetical protein DITRI_Ditri14bG0049600 [Diplodiscus trichospermus]